MRRPAGESELEAKNRENSLLEDVGAEGNCRRVGPKGIPVPQQVEDHPILQGRRL